MSFLVAQEVPLAAGTPWNLRLTRKLESRLAAATRHVNLVGIGCSFSVRADTDGARGGIVVSADHENYELFRYSNGVARAVSRSSATIQAAARTVHALGADAANGERLSWYRRYWTDETSVFVEGALAGFGLSWLALEFWLKRSGRGNRFARSRSVVLALIGIVSAGAYVDFGAWHFWSRIHSWDTFHYYVGAKYFRELSYEHLYECVAIADAEEAPLRAQVAKRAMRDLRTNVLGDTASILADPDRCKAHFSAARWFSFKKDVAYFRQALGSKRWEKAQTDHGFNGTPVWLLLGPGESGACHGNADQRADVGWTVCCSRVALR